LAEQNNWITFLYEAESQQFPINQVLHIAEHYFTNVGLREHLSLALRNSILKKEVYIRNYIIFNYYCKGNQELHPLPDPHAADMFEIIVAAMKRPNPGTHTI
jgi:hypothetical protein